MVAVQVLLLLLLGFCALGAVPADRIEYMPNFPGNVSFAQYSGYVSAGGAKRLHYWYVESQRDPRSDPLLLWLNGGPGCSSLYGLMRELGPFQFDRKNPSDMTLYANKYSWNLIANIVFFESPVGVGFSYSTSQADYSNDDTNTARDNYAALLDFLRLYPELAGRDFYIAGESYAGMYIPMLAREISLGNDAGQPFINLQGFLSGNAVTEPNADSSINSLAPFSFGHGLISQKTFEKIQECNNGETSNNPQCILGLSEMNTQLRGINRYSVLEDCEETSVKIDWSVLEWGDNINSEIPCVSSQQDNVYFNTLEVKQALHVQTDILWTICSDTLRYTKNLGSNSYQFYPELVAKYRIIVFSGDTDAAVPYVGSETWTRKLGGEPTQDWRAWTVSGQVAGYVTTYPNLQFVTFKGGWHTVPESHPEESLYMIDRFFQNLPL